MREFLSLYQSGSKQFVINDCCEDVYKDISWLLYQENISPRNDETLIFFR